MAAQSIARRVFVLQPYQSPVTRERESVRFIVITPEDTDPAVVQAAWSYAVRYTAKGLDLPDNEAAAKLLLDRHPSWTLVESMPHTINIDLSKADEDRPEKG